MKTPPAPLKTLTADIPNGPTLTRTTNHDYKFVLAVRGGNSATDESWGPLLWTTRRDLADKKLAYWRGINHRLEYPFTEMIIIPVNEA